MLSRLQHPLLCPSHRFLYFNEGKVRGTILCTSVEQSTVSNGSYKLFECNSYCRFKSETQTGFCGCLQLDVSAYLYFFSFLLFLIHCDCLLGKYCFELTCACYRSTGHQVGSGVSKPAIYHKARVSKLQRQYRQNPPPLSLLASPTKGPGTRQRSASPSAQAHAGPEHPSTTLAIVPVEAEDPPTFAPASKTTSTKQPKRIFANCTVYINGTTAPAISDIMLKRHLSSHGACIATGLARKTVTHVIIGKPNGGQGDGAGGGLAAGKLHKELTKNGNLIKFVSVNW